jgi:ABC-type uncharacterized transport system permease subunit
MLPSVSTICFASSYGVALALELTRFFFRAPVRRAIMVGFVLAGLVAHFIFLTLEVSAQRPLSSWYLGCLVLAGMSAILYVIVTARQETSVTGLSLLTLCMVLIGAARVLPEQALSSSLDSYRVFGMVHGLSLLLGSTLVVVGFLAAVMYLIQSFRLKHKLRPRTAFWLPSLERLHRINERSLLGSIFFLGSGLFAGLLLNLGETGRSVPWSDPIVWASGVWFTWLISVSIFQTVYRPSRQGRKVAYLTIASFAFLSIVLAILFLAPNHHGGKSRPQVSTTRVQHALPSSAFAGRSGSSI